MKPDQEFIKKYTELYGEDIQFAKTSDETVLAGTLGEDGKFYAVDSVTGGGIKPNKPKKLDNAKMIKNKRPISKKTSDVSAGATPATKDDDGVYATATPQSALFSAVERALKAQFDARIQAGHNPFEEFKIPAFFKTE